MFSLSLKISQADSKDQLQEAAGTGEMIDALWRSGWLRPLTMENKVLAAQCLLVHEVLVKRREPIEQLIEGLETLGLVTLIRANPQLMNCYFMAKDAP